MIIPDSIIKHFPKFIQDNPDAGFLALANKIDDIFQQIESDIEIINFFNDPVKCPASYLTDLGYLVNAGIFYQDSEIIKRKKISEAVLSHKKRGQWANDAKLRIDNITAYDARILLSVDNDDWIMLGDSTDPPYYWGTMGADGIDSSLGLALTGDGTEIVIQGNIYINCHYGITASTLSATQIAQIVLELEFDVIPAYFIIYLGYLDGTGAFIQYAGGIIGA